MNKEKSRKTGIWAATGVVLTQGLEAVMLPIVFYAAFMIMMSKDNGVAYSSGIMSIKETFSLILISIYLGPKIMIKSIKLMFKKRNSFFILSGVIGTATGNLFFIVGIVLAGPSYGVILTAFYPIFAVGLNKIIYKEKDNWLSKVGMVLSILSGALFVIIPTLLEGGKIDTKKIIGMFCGLFAAFFWALDGLFLKVAMDKNPEVNQKEILAIKTISVTFVTWIVFVPVSMLINHSFQKGAFFNTYTEFYGSIFTEPKAWIVWMILFIAGFNIVILRVLHTKSIDLIGQKLTAIIDTNNFIVPAIFALVLQFLPGRPGEEFKESLFIPYLWLLLIPLCLGLYLILRYHNDAHPPQLHKQHEIEKSIKPTKVNNEIKNQ